MITTWERESNNKHILGAFNVKGNGTLVEEGFEVWWLAPPTKAFNSFYLEAGFCFLYILGSFFRSFSTSCSCVARGFYNFNSNNKFVCEGGRQRRRLKNSWYVIFLDTNTEKAPKKKLRTFFVVIEIILNKNRFGKTLFLGSNNSLIFFFIEESKNGSRQHCYTAYVN